jgi:4-hydroxyproline epimerase
VTIENVPARAHATDVRVDVPGYGTVTGDIAWGGNWFFLVNEGPCDLELRNLEALTDYTWRIRQALASQNITGADGHEIDHIELFSKPHDPSAHSRNFVLCPGKSYDRSPCGTGTSAKLACLYADGKLAEGQVWRQESVIGSVFEGSVAIHGGEIYPRIKGSAFVTSEARFVLQDGDPFCWGIPS